MEPKDLIKLGIGVMLFLAWILLVVLHVQGADDIITAIKVALGGLGAYHLNDRTNMPPPSAQAVNTTFVVPPGSSSQRGFASISTLLLLVFLSACALLLGGCASQIQAVSAFNKSAVVSARAASDLFVDDVKAATCSITIDTYARHPELTDSITSLCLNPNSAKSSTPNQAQVLSNFKAAAAGSTASTPAVQTSAPIPAATAPAAAQ